MIGKIYSGERAILRRAVGDATTQEGSVRFELSVNVDSSPIIRSTKTGKYYLLPWAHIVDLAVKEGIEVEDKEGV